MPIPTGPATGPHLERPQFATGRRTAATRRWRTHGTTFVAGTIIRGRSGSPWQPCGSSSGSPRPRETRPQRIPAASGNDRVPPATAAFRRTNHPDPCVPLVPQAAPPCARAYVRALAVCLRCPTIAPNTLRCFDHHRDKPGTGVRRRAVSTPPLEQQARVTPSRRPFAIAHVRSFTPVPEGGTHQMPTLKMLLQSNHRYLVGLLQAHARHHADPDPRST